MGMIW